MNQIITTIRYRFYFCKQGDLRWIGHLDLIRTFERICRMIELPLCMSHGFHPKPKIRFGSALALGLEGLDEWVEVELNNPLDRETILRQLQDVSPNGLKFTRVEIAQKKMPTLEFARYEIKLPENRLAEVKAAVDQLWQTTGFQVERSGRNEPVDVRLGLKEIAVEDGTLQFTCTANRRGAIRPREVLLALQADDLESHGAVLRRVELIFAEPEEALSHADQPATLPEPSVGTPDLDPHILE